MLTIYCLTCIKWMKRLGDSLAETETHIGACCDSCLEKSIQRRKLAEELLDRRSLRS